MKRASIVLAIALVLILVGAWLSVGVDNDFGKVHTQRLFLVNDRGYTVTANLFMPKAATPENPAPAFISASERTRQRKNLIKNHI